MRFLPTALLAVLAAVSISACSSTTSSSSSDTTASSAAADNSMASSSSSDAGAMAGASTQPSAAPAAGGSASDVPMYPGAKTEAAGSSMAMGGMSSGKVLTTADSFDKVYAWYQKNMPAGSEKAHTTAPVQSAVFTLGEAGKDQQTLTITVANGKTTIAIAHVKQ